MKFYEYLLRWGREKGGELFYEDEEMSRTFGEALGLWKKKRRNWLPFLLPAG